MHIGFVLGNGISRRGISGPELMKIGRVYACNAIYREFTPYVLVATDMPIAKRIQESGYALSNKFYTRRPIVNMGALPVPHFTYSSGPNAIHVAALDDCNPLYLLGFDMGATEDGKFNNMYSDSEFYKPSSSHPTFTGNWVKQIFSVIASRPHQRFIRVMGTTTTEVPELQQLSNYETMAIGDFVTGVLSQTTR